MKTNYENTSMLDMVFENRNQAYGAYVLRRDQDKFLMKGLLITIGLIGTLLLYYFFYDIFHTQHSKKLRDIIVDVIPLDIKPQVTPRIEPPKAPAQAKATAANTEKRLVRNDQVQSDSIPQTKDLQAMESGLITTTNVSLSGFGVPDGTSTGTSLETVAPPVAQIESAPVDFAEIAPEFPGGEKKLREFLIHHTEYPSGEQAMELQGKAVVKFVVNEDGSVSDAEIIKSDSRGFSKEAIRVVSMLPKFKPGMQSGRPVRVRYVLPFVWKMNN